MFRWWKDKKKPKKDRKNRIVEDDYGFRKRAIIVQETASGHTVIIKDDLTHPNVLKFGASCRARMPTPVQNFSETSSHIYDEIPEIPLQTQFPSQTENEADIVKDARARQRVHLRNAIEVGPYLIVPVVDPTCSNTDVEIFKRNECNKCSNLDNASDDCQCNTDSLEDDCNKQISCNPSWDDKSLVDSQTDVLRDTKIVLTRCVKSKSSFQDLDGLQQLCSNPKSEPDLCSFETLLKPDEVSRAMTGSPGAESNSRTLTGTPVSNSRTPLLITGNENDESEGLVVSNIVEESHETDGALGEYLLEISEKFETRGVETSCDYDLSTSEGSNSSGNSDYDVYLSKVESNLKLKHNVRQIIKSLETTIEEETDDTSSDYHDCAFGFRECPNDKFDRDSITYVSSLSEYSSAASHISDISADRSASDDSSGYYDCTDDTKESRDMKRDSRVNLERSVSAPDGNSSCSKSKEKKSKYRNQRQRQSQNRSNSFDCSIYKPLSQEQNQEMYYLPVSSKGDSDSSSSSSGLQRKNKSKPVLTPQPTPVYMDPYRGRSRSHNRLLGDLIRMNYDKQTFIQR